MQHVKKTIAAAAIAAIAACALFTGQLSKADLTRELGLVAQDIRDAALVVEDPGTKADLDQLALELDTVVAMLETMPDSTEAGTLAKTALELTDVMLKRDDLSEDAKLALLAVRAVLRRVPEPAS